MDNEYLHVVFPWKSTPCNSERNSTERVDIDDPESVGHLVIKTRRKIFKSAQPNSSSSSSGRRSLGDELKSTCGRPAWPAGVPGRRDRTTSPDGVAGRRGRNKNLMIWIDSAAPGWGFSKTESEKLSQNRIYRCAPLRVT